MSLLSSQPAAYVIISILGKGTLILGTAWLLIRCLRSRSASLRHVVWMLAFASLLILPVTEGFVPDVGILPESARPVTEQVDGLIYEGRMSESVPVAQERQSEGTGSAESDAPVGSKEPGSSSTAVGASGGEDRSWGFLSWSWSTWLIGCWLAGCVLLLVRLAMGLIHLDRIGREASEVTGPVWRRQLSRLQQQRGVDRRIHIVTHPEIEMPMTWGLCRTVILLPMDASTWSVERRRVVLLHELAHIARRDYLTHLIVQLATILHWINPLAWIGARQALAEREKASDDYVLSAGVRPSFYARQLLSTVEEMTRSSAASRVAAAMARSSKIRSRIESICRPSQDRRLLRRRHVVLLGGLMVTATVLLGAVSLDSSPDLQLFSWAEADRSIVIEGRLLGANGQPMARAHVQLDSGPAADAELEQQQEVAADGTFELRVSEPGHYMLLMMGPHHEVGEVPVFIREDLSHLWMDVQLSTHRFRSSIDTVRVLTAAAGFELDRAVVMDRRPDGTFTASVQASADTLAYKLLGVAGHPMAPRTRSMAGTHHDRVVFNSGGPFWDSAGDYYSVLEDVGDRAEIRFDPGMLPEVDDSIRIEMSDPTAERMARVSAEMRNLERRAGRYNAVHMSPGGEDSDEPRGYDWTPHREEFQARIAQADDTPFRDYLLLHVFNSMHVPAADSMLARQFLEDVDPTAPVWSNLGWYTYSLSNVLHYVEQASGRQDETREYMHAMIEQHPDPDVRVQALYRAVGNARHRGSQEQFRRLYDQMMDEFGDRRLAEQIRKRYSPDRAIQVGKQVPGFSAASVDDTSEILTPNDLRGSVYLVDFWFAGTGSHARVEHLREAYDQYSEEGLEIVSVFIEDDRGEVQEYLRDLPPMPWPVVMNGTGDTSMADRFEVTGVPHFTLIDERGQIIATDADLGYTAFDSTLAAVFEQ